MATRIKCKKWCIERLHYDGLNGRYELFEGDTSIGRNKTADIVVTSPISSREHCVITVKPDNNIVIANKVRICIILCANLDSFF